jgi:drug/metabolite transporter (DMT)-like permease
MVFGEVIALCSALFWGTGNLLVRRGQTASGESGMLVTTLVNSVVIGCILLVQGVIGVTHGTGFVRAITGGVGLRPVGLAWFVAAGVLTTLMGRSLFFASMKVIGPSRAASLKGTSPIFTAVLAVLAVGEAYSLRRGLGTVVALAGLWILNGEMESMAGRAARAGVATSGANPGSAPDGGLAGRPSDAGAAPEALPSYEGRPAPPPVEGGSGQEDRDGSGPGASPGSGSGGAAPAQKAAGWLAGHRRGVLLGLLCAASFGSGAVLRKVGLDVLPTPVLGSWISSTLACATIFATTGAGGRLGEALRNNRRGLGPFLLAGVATTIAQLMVFVAYSLSAVSLAAVLASLDPVFTVGLSSLVLRREREHITPRTVLGVLLTVAGAAAVLGS